MIRRQPAKEDMKQNKMPIGQHNSPFPMESSLTRYIVPQKLLVNTQRNVHDHADDSEKCRTGISMDLFT